jgi:8-oxo-dGTP pyrophosphatase MutT (NUDIX family)
MREKNYHSDALARTKSSPLISAGALIYCPSTYRYLFLLRNGHSHDGSWGLAGGKIDTGETVIAGLLREIQEELNLDVSDNKIIPVEKFTSESGHFVYHTFVIRVDSEFVPELNHEHRGYCWVPLDDYPRPLHPGVWRTVNFQSIMEKIRTLETVL